MEENTSKPSFWPIRFAFLANPVTAGFLFLLTQNKVIHEFDAYLFYLFFGISTLMLTLLLAITQQSDPFGHYDKLGYYLTASILFFFFIGIFFHITVEQVLPWISINTLVVAIIGLIASIDKRVFYTIFVPSSYQSVESLRIKSTISLLISLFILVIIVGISGENQTLPQIAIASWLVFNAINTVRFFIGEHLIKQIQEKK